MGTNFYLRVDACPHCRRSDERKHIGKSSAGWCFGLHVIPEEGINSLEDWKKLFDVPGNRIFNEYGEELNKAQMLAVITERGWQGWSGLPSGYRSWTDFHASNHSQPGPKGLLRHQVGDHCVAHGEGTWDLIPGEFS
jgi:hypothetical protein